MDAQIPPPAERTRPPSPQAADVAKPTQRIEGLDGLRAVSILFVLIGHGAHTAGAPSAMRPFGGMGIVGVRSEEHTSELKSLMRISYAVLSLKKQKTNVITDDRKNKTNTSTQY